VRNAGPLLARGFGSADFEIAIDGDRVTANDLAPEALGQMNSERRFAGCCGAKDYDEQQLRRHSPNAPGNGLAEAKKNDGEKDKGNR